MSTAAMAQNREDSTQSPAQEHVREDVPVSAPVPHPSIVPPGDVSIQLHLPTPTSEHPHRQPIRHLYVL